MNQNDELFIMVISAITIMQGVRKAWLWIVFFVKSAATAAGHSIGAKRKSV